MEFTHYLDEVRRISRWGKKSIVNEMISGADRGMRAAVTTPFFTPWKGPEEEFESMVVLATWDRDRRAQGTVAWGRSLKGLFKENFRCVGFALQKALPLEAVIRKHRGIYWLSKGNTLL